MEEQQNKENDHDPVAIVDLNDDCFESIFKILDLPQQIHVAKCCIRFRNIMVGLWKRHPVYKTLDFDLLLNELPNSDFKYFLIAMKQEFRTCHILSNGSSFVKKIEEYGIDCFTAIEMCDVYCCDDDAMEVFTKLMPNLKHLHTYTTHITGRHIKNFKYLQELHLKRNRKLWCSFELCCSCEYQMREEYLKEILVNLKNLRLLDIRNIQDSHLNLMPEISECLQLQNLRLSLSALKPVLDHVLKLPRLKILRVTLDRKIYETKEYIIESYKHILKEKGQILTGLAINMNYLPVSFLPIRLNDFHSLNPANLKLLALNKFDFSSREHCLLPFTGLEMLRLTASKNLQPLTILEIVRLCPNLKHLDLTNSLKLDVSLLNPLNAFLKKEKRSTSLCVYYGMFGLTNEIKKNLAFWTSQNYLQLIEGVPPGDGEYVCSDFGFHF